MNKLERSIKKINKKIHNTNDFLMSSPRALFNRISMSNESRTPEPKRITFEFTENESLLNLKIADQTKKFESDENFLEQEKEFTNSIGLNYLPLQIQRKFVKNNFSFTLMVVGQSGLGKSTFINSMFLTNIYNEQYPGPTKRSGKTVDINSMTVLLKENSVNVLLTIVDTPGFGDSLDNTNCWQSIEKYIEQKHFDFLNSELYIGTKAIDDQRIHCCLYFIQPSGQSLKAIDIEFMKHLHEKVNLIPIIAKADSLTPEELIVFKSNIMRSLEENKIKIYEFPEIENNQTKTEYSNLKSRIPFAIVSSNYTLKENGKSIFGRKYPWGTVNIENLDHCDFKALQDLLIKHCMYDLVDHTHTVHYEHYRRKHLRKILPNNFN